MMTPHEIMYGYCFGDESVNTVFMSEYVMCSNEK